MTYTPPTKGKQTVQTYHPERGEQFRYQVSTYNGDRWLIAFCGSAGLAQVKKDELKRALI